MKTISIQINGVSPMLVHAIPMNVLFPENGTQKTSSVFGGDKGDPRSLAAKHLYLTADGKPMMPGANIYKCIMEAGRFHKMGKKQVTTRDTSLVPAGIWIVQTEVIIHPSNWEVHSKMVTNEATKSKVPCHRPRFDNWHLEFELEVDTTLFDLKLVRLLVDDAGKKIGLGSHRPERKGPFGRFVVTKWVVSKDEAQRSDKELVEAE